MASRDQVRPRRGGRRLNGGVQFASLRFAAAVLCTAGVVGAGQAAAFDIDAKALAAAVRVELPALPPSAAVANRDVEGPVRIGVHRSLSASVGELAPRLNWTPRADGGVVAAVVVASEGAAFVRIAIKASLGPGGELRYFQPGQPPLGHAIVTEADFVGERLGGENGVLWSPSVAGDSIGVEIVLPSAPSARTSQAFSFSVVKIAHGTVDRNAPATWRPKALVCDNHVDVRCRAEQFPAGLDDAVARVVFESGGGTYSCTGTLLRDRPASGEAFFLTASHCVGTAAEANSVETTWFFQRPSCGASNIDRGITVYGGANLLATSVAQDSSLLALRGDLPSGADYADWTPRRPAHPAHVIGIHHPAGEEKRYAGGATLTNNNAIVGAREITRDALIVRWDDGLTERGSSGSGLFHEGALVGVLSGGAGCTDPQDAYGPFADFHPRACPWLSPGAVCVDDGNAPLFLAAGDGRRESFARVVNHSAKPGSLWIHPRDDSGRAFPSLTVPIGANAVVHFNSTDLEMGNPRKGIAEGVGAGVGNWRLRVDADVDVEVLAYVRTNSGFVTSMHELIPPQWNGNYQVPFFNPASNRSQESLLRLANPNGEDVNIVIRGVDDAGALSSTVALSLAPREARAVTARQLETGASTLEGALGDGAGKWRLLITPSQPIEAMSLLETPGGKLTNLSTIPLPVSWLADHLGFRAPFFSSARHAAQQGFVRLFNYGLADAAVSVFAVDDAGERHGSLDLPLRSGAALHFNSDDWEDGNPDKGIPESFAGDGNWRLEFEQLAAGVQMLAYTRSKDGFVTAMHDVVPGPNKRHQVPFFNPASNTAQVSKLRLVNPADQPASVTIRGLDDHGEAGAADVRLRLNAGAARMITAQQLEAGGAALTGKLGDGRGKWRLHVSADQEIDAVNLLESPTGDIANLSTGTRAP